MGFKQKISHYEIWGWGHNDNGALGTGNVIKQSSPVQMLGGSNWSDNIGTGERSTGAVDVFGYLWVMGKNASGQLGLGQDSYQPSSPTQVGTTNDWSRVAMAQDSSLFVKKDGTRWGAGKNSNATLADNTAVDRPYMLQCDTSNQWAEMAAEQEFSFGLKTDGTLWSWGKNADGRLGINSTVNQSSPVQVGTDTWSKISCEGGGNSTAAGIRTNGTLWTWGKGLNGELGNDFTGTVSSPVQVGSGTDWSEVAMGTHCLAIKTNGTLWSWGLGSDGQLGSDNVLTRSSPVQIGSDTWSKVAVGAAGKASAAIKSDGTLWTWGSSDNGQLGDGTVVSKSSPVQISSGTDWSNIKGCDKHFIATKFIRTQNHEKGPYLSKEKLLDKYEHLLPSKKKPQLWVWGDASEGALGENQSTAIDRSSPVQTISQGTNWKQFELGLDCVMAIKTDGTLWGWGDNLSGGNLGDLTTTNRSSPVQTVAGGSNWKQVAQGDIHNSAAIKTDGTLWCWGINSGGNLGVGSILHRSSPTQVGSSNDWSKVACGYNGIAIKTDGTLWVWGPNNQGGLGIGTTANTSSPVQVGSGTDWSQVGSGIFFSAALKTDGTLWTWGYNAYGQLGNDTALNTSSPVQTVGGGNDWRYMSAKAHTLAAIKVDGSLWVCGNNFNGELGDNTVADKSSPVQTIAGGNDWRYVAPGRDHTLAIKTDGTLWGWGKSDKGQVGDGTVISRSSPVQNAAGGNNWKQVKASFDNSAAISEADDW